MHISWLTRWKRATVLFSLTAVLLWLVTSVFSSPVIAQTGPPETVGSVGAACGNGEKLPDDVICVAGKVIQIGGTIADNAIITISYQGREISVTTFIHPGQAQAAYGINIAPLDPQFLQPITITARSGQECITLQVLAFPDLTTQTQDVPLRLHDCSTAALSPVLRGQVIDYATHQSVAGAIVHAAYSGGEQTVETIISGTGQLEDDASGYRFANLPSHTPITLTVDYYGDRDQRVVELAGQELNVDFVTGWRCDDISAAPRGGARFGLPRGSPGRVGLPDPVCIWGFGLLNGIPTAGMEVSLAISNEVYSGVTYNLNGEEQPRFAIVVPLSQISQVTTALVLARYNNANTAQPFTVTLDSYSSQQVNVNLVTAQGVQIVGDMNAVRSMAFQEWQGHKYLWVGTFGTGLLRWDINATPVTYTHYTTLDGLISLTAMSIMTDKRGHVFVANGTPKINIFDSSTESWSTVGPIDNSLNGTSGVNEKLQVDSCDNLWAISSQLLHQSSISSAAQIELTPLSSSMREIPEGGRFFDLFVEPDCDLWGVYRQSKNDQIPYVGLAYLQYVSASKTYSDTWYAVTTPSGIPNWDTILHDPKGTFWIHTRNLDSITQLSVTQESLPQLLLSKSYSISVGAPETAVSIAPMMHVDTQGRLWARDMNGVQYLDQSTGIWNKIPLYDQLSGVLAETVASDPWEGNLWIGLYGDGVKRYNPDSIGLVETYMDSENAISVPGDAIQAVTSLNDGSIVSIGHGVSYYSPADGKWQKYGGNQKFTCMTHDPEKNELWFCGENSNEIYHWKPLDAQPITLALSLPAPASKITVVEGQLWIGTDDKGVYVYDTNTLSVLANYTLQNTDWLLSNRIFDIEKVGGDLWIGTDAGVAMFNPTLRLTNTLTMSNTEGHLFAPQVRRISVDRDGMLWFGVCDENCEPRGGISAPYDSRTKRWIELPGLPVIESGIQSIDDIFIDSSQEPWIGVSPNGILSSEWSLGHYNLVKQQFEKFSLSDGLPSSYILDIDAINDSTLLLAGDSLGWWQIEKRQSDLALEIKAPNLLLSTNTNVYTVTVANLGSKEALSSTLALTLPISTTYAGASLTPSSTTPLVWNLGTISPGETITVAVETNADDDISNGTRLSISGYVTTTSTDPFPNNNQASASTKVRTGVDLGISVVGPSLVAVTQPITYTISLENLGGFSAPNPQLTTSSPVDLSGCAPQVLEARSAYRCTVALQADVTGTVSLGVSAKPLADERNLGNNSATWSVEVLPQPTPVPGQPIPPPAPPRKKTLILVAPTYLEGVSLIMPRLQELAKRPDVDGMILNVLDDSQVRAAYQSSDPKHPTTIQSNNLAKAIKSFVRGYITSATRFLVIVGGDRVIPFYRVPDRSDKQLNSWSEGSFGRYFPQDSYLYGALSDNVILTDDYYTALDDVQVNSTSWDETDRSFHLPTIVSGRLVEDAEEIVTTIDAYLANDSFQYAPQQVLVASETGLTDDLGSVQCTLTGNDPSCSQSANALRSINRDTLVRLFLAAVHSNPQSLGSFTIYDEDSFIQWFDRVFSNSILLTIGCHSGLNLPNELDLVEMFLTHHGYVIGSTAYAYASTENIAYSEDLAKLITEQLSNAPTLGEALIQAKRQYFMNRNGLSGGRGWFDHVDEKVLLGMTYYGLPMLRLPQNPQTWKSGAVVTSSSMGVTSVLAFTNLTYKPQPTEQGNYYTLTSGLLNGATLTYPVQLLAQSQRPVQPMLQIPFKNADQPSVSGILLISARYADETNKQPYYPHVCAIAEVCVTGNASKPQSPTGWDNDLPYAFGTFQDATNCCNATLNLVLGAWNATSFRQRLFSNITLKTVYSEQDESSTSKPVITSLRGYTDTTTSKTMLRAEITYSGTLTTVQVICDDGSDSYKAVDLVNRSHGVWVGACPWIAERFYPQVVDEVGSVVNSVKSAPDFWQTSSNELFTKQQSIYLPLVLNNKPAVSNTDNESLDNFSTFLPLIQR